MYLVLLIEKWIIFQNFYDQQLEFDETNINIVKYMNFLYKIQ